MKILNLVSQYFRHISTNKNLNILITNIFRKKLMADREGLFQLIVNYIS